MRFCSASLAVFLASGCALLGHESSAASDIPKHWDADYTKAIREHTTAPEFLNELVDHVPRSRRIPSPLDFLGYVPGTPGKLTYAADVHAYMRALAKASPNVAVESIGKTEEGREMLLVVIADRRTLRRLDRFKKISRTLSDPRDLSDRDAKALIERAKPMYWLTGGLHSPETGSPEMLMELAYRLAVEDTDRIKKIRKNVITMLTPVIEVDGRERMVDTIRWWQQNKQVGAPPLIYWGKYVAHDNNRDTLSFSLALSRNVLATFLDYRPQVLHDLHESIPFLYISTGTGPYNAWLDPVAIDTWRAMAQYEVSELTQRGMPGVWNHGFYDGWAPSYMFYIAHAHNAIGRFYETFGNSTPDTRERRIDRSSERAWYRPNPPYPVVQWSLRNNINYSQSGVLMALSYAAQNHKKLVRLSHTLAKRSVAKARTEGPAAYVLPASQARRGQMRDLLNLLQLQGVEVHTTVAPTTIEPAWPPKRPDDDDDDSKKKEKAEKPAPIKVAAGSYVIRMDQPYSRLADMLLDTQFYRSDDPRPYDDTGWTMGLSKNVVVHRIVNPAILDVKMARLHGPVTTSPVRPKVTTAGPTAVVADADVDLYRFLWRAGIDRARIIDEPVKTARRRLPRGSVVIPRSGRKALEAADGLAVEIVPLGKRPKVTSHELRLPRIALVHTWYRTQDEGWYRLALDGLGIPYDYLSTQDVARAGDLSKRYDVILFPPCGCSPDRIVWGLPEGPPIPWKKSELTPNLGRVDSTDDIRPGLGYGGLANLRRFVQQGGTLITVRDTARLAVQYGLVQDVALVNKKQLKAPGTLLSSRVSDPRSPLVYGYDDTVPVYFAGGPVFRVGRFHEPDEPRKRPTGRGGKRDPDVLQGRRFVDRPPKQDLPAHERGFVPTDGDVTARLKVRIPPVEQRPRVVLRYAKKPDDLLLSGMLAGAKAIADTPAVIDAPVGKGHVVLFGINPMWRQQTQGTFALVLNAMLHHRSLETGWPPKKGT